MLLNNQEITKEIKQEILKIYQKNDIENIMAQNLPVQSLSHVQLFAAP